MRRARLLALAFGVAALADGMLHGGEIPITAADFPLEVGTRIVLAIERADGAPAGQLTYALTDERRIGAHRLFRQAVFFRRMQPRDTWLAVTDTTIATYESLSARTPTWVCRLPLTKATTHEYDSKNGRVTARVDGTEDVTVPAGKFTCLVCVERWMEGDVQKARKAWYAPGTGLVQNTISVEQDYTLKLVRIDKPREAKPEPGTEFLSHFDSGDLLAPLPFPKAQWYGGAGNAAASSVVEIDPRGGANGTPFCLRWTYHTKGTWVGASFFPGGSMGVPADLSKYHAISFYIKALRPGRCSLSIRARKTEGEGHDFVHMPIPLTTGWQKVVISPETQAEFGRVDLKAVSIFSISDYNQGEASNVVWLDEFILHKNRPQATF